MFFMRDLFERVFLLDSIIHQGLLALRPNGLVFMEMFHVRAELMDQVI